MRRENRLTFNLTLRFCVIDRASMIARQNINSWHALQGPVDTSLRNCAAKFEF